MPDAHRLSADAILDARTRSLARRGLAGSDEATTLPPHLVCRVGGRLLGMRPTLVETVRSVSFHPMPFLRGTAAGVTLGVFAHHGRFYSLLDLGRLLSPDAPPAAQRGAMLLLRMPRQGVPAGASAHRLALHVDAVLGVLALTALPATEGVSDATGLGLLPSDVPSDTASRLVSLIDPRASIAALLDGQATDLRRPLP